MAFGPNEGAGGGGESPAMIAQHGMLGTFGPVVHGVVPSGVATVPLHYAASGQSTRRLPPLTVTTDVQGNVFAVSIPRATGSGRRLPAHNGLALSPGPHHQDSIHDQVDEAGRITPAAGLCRPGDAPRQARTPGLTSAQTFALTTSGDLSTLRRRVGSSGSPRTKVDRLMTAGTGVVASEVSASRSTLAASRRPDLLVVWVCLRVGLA
jgi:hypothetical protein